tara:strand:- start:14399 stop:15673 length:1275 start_codon:yes stop_codon:yes gene_type:complete
MTIKSKYHAVRGMTGSLPKENLLWRTIEDELIQILSSYSFQEIRLPIIEYSGIFNRSIGESSDIVQKEMYSFTDRNGESLTLRPEGTAGCVRAAIENNLLSTSAPLRLWYHGPMFRYERPQRGRQRQFHQIGLEIFGADSVLAETELMIIFSRFWSSLGISDITLQINSLGNQEDRQAYIKVLTDFFSNHSSKLSEHNLQKLRSNPLRILDSKDPEIIKLISDAPTLDNFISEEARARFTDFKNLLSMVGINFKENNKLVRGLDYYSDIVFEWTTESLGAQNAVCAGGRYDDLIGQLGGKHTSAVGCAVGLERVVELCEQKESLKTAKMPKLFVLSTDAQYSKELLVLCEKLRDMYPKICFELDISERSLKSKMKKADKSEAEAAIIIGQQEIEEGTLTVRPLRNSRAQKSCNMSELEDFLKGS